MEEPGLDAGEEGRVPPVHSQQANNRKQQTDGKTNQEQTTESKQTEKKNQEQTTESSKQTEKTNQEQNAELGGR